MVFQVIFFANFVFLRQHQKMCTEVTHCAPDGQKNISCAALMFNALLRLRCIPWCQSHLSSRMLEQGFQTFSVHEPLQHFNRWACTPKHEGQKDFFQGGANSAFSRGGPKYFCRGSKCGKIWFSPLQIKKTPFYQKIWWENVKFQNAGAALAPPFDAHAPKTSHDKKAEEDNKNIFTNKHIMIFENNIHWYLF